MIDPEHKPIKTVLCIDRLPNFSSCREPVYESDGVYMYIRAMSGNLYKFN